MNLPLNRSLPMKCHDKLAVVPLESAAVKQKIGEIVKLNTRDTNCKRKYVCLLANVQKEEKKSKETR